MGWATGHIAKLQQGETVKFRPRGTSMTPIVRSGQLVTVIPVTDVTTLLEGDIVLCKVFGNQYLHLIKAARQGQYQIGNAHGRINGWVTRRAIYGKCIKVED